MKKNIQAELPGLTKVQLLEEVINVLAAEDNWCKGAFARDGLGEKCKATDKHACAYCVYGAARSVVEDKNLSLVFGAMADLCRINNLPSVPVWNDLAMTTHKNVIDVLKNTIEKLNNEK